MHWVQRTQLNVLPYTPVSDSVAPLRSTFALAGRRAYPIALRLKEVLQCVDFISKRSRLHTDDFASEI